MINAIELVLLGTAFGVSKWRLTPLILLCFNLFTQVMEFSSNEVLSYYDKPGVPIEFADTALIHTYLIESACMFFFAVALYYIRSRVSLVASLVVIAQALLSCIAALSVYMIASYGYNLDWVFELHSIINNCFVIVYVVIAWTCVLMSRMTKGNL